ncbi:MAG: helix-turn-helix transcriptional regulator [Burkholderiaceae bacterium]|nr:helix-turn-helix transcriptional regulator [Burkholderiaceae bacterium]
MTEGPNLAKLAALLAEPARAQMLTLLLAGQALTATELADTAGVARSTASAHLSKLETAGFLACVPQGRHRYYRLADEGVAEILEQMLGIASRAGAMPLLTGPRDAALREARVCYDHLAGRHAVAMLARLQAAGVVVREGVALSLGPQAQQMLGDLGIDADALKRGKRVPCRACLDWSERRDHLAGALGAALLQLALERGWLRREQDTRAVTFTASGLAAWNAIADRAAAGELMRE